MRSKSLIVAAFALTAGCASVDPVSQSPDPAFGEAVKHNAALQTINPDPVYAPGSAQPGDMGERGQAAVERLRSGEVHVQHKQEVGAARNSGLSTTEGTEAGPK